MTAKQEAKTASESALKIHPLTPRRWSDFEALFDRRGACGGCWCMWWRLTRSIFEAQQGEENRRAMREIVERGVVPGILGYLDGAPAAWCSVAPREQFASLNRSRVLRPLDDQPVWSIVCLFIEKAHRGKGLSVAMINEAAAYAGRRGGRLAEAYPTVPRSGNVPPFSSFMGLPEMYFRAGFTECARPSKARMIVRRRLDP